jgi:hypothetical protein
MVVLVPVTGETEFCVPDVETEFCVPDVETEFCVPDVETEFCVPDVETEFCVPDVEEEAPLCSPSDSPTARAAAASSAETPMTAIRRVLFLAG